MSVDRLFSAHLVDGHVVVWTSPLFEGRPDLAGAVLMRLAAELGTYHADWPTYSGTDERISPGLHEIERH